MDDWFIKKFDQFNFLPTFLPTFNNKFNFPFNLFISCTVEIQDELLFSSTRHETHIIILSMLLKYVLFFIFYSSLKLSIIKKKKRTILDEGMRTTALSFP